MISKNNSSKRKHTARPNKKTTQKNVSIRQIVTKMVDIVKSTVKNTESIKKPFGGKGGRKKKLTPVQQRMKAAEERIAKIEQESNSDHIQSSSGYDPAGSFFYTDEKFMTQFEDNEITEYLHRVHDDFEPSLHDDSKLKKAIIDILNDITLMEKTLSRYNMTILDFFKYLYRVEPSIFRGLFIQRIQNALKNKQYANVRARNYKFRQLQGSKRSGSDKD